jgi:hypothetical protein
VVESGAAVLGIEVKATSRPGAADVRGLRAFRDEYSDLFAGGLLLHTGVETQWLSDRILAVPWHRIV